MGLSRDYPDSEWPPFRQKGPEGFPRGARCKHRGMAWEAAFWAPGDSAPGEGDPGTGPWRMTDELYDLTSRPHEGPVNIACYVPTWRKAEQYLENTEQFNHMTHAMIAFLMFDESGGLTAESVAAVEETIAATRGAAKDRGTRLMVSVGGSTDHAFRRLCEKGGTSADDPAFVAMCENIVGFVRKHRLDGVDLDLECWGDAKDGATARGQGGRSFTDGPHAAGTGLVSLAGLLRKDLPSPDHTLSCAVTATAWYGNNYDVKGLSEHTDWIGVTTYDFTGAGETSPCGPHSETLHIRRQKDYLDDQQGKWPPLSGHMDPEDNPILSVEDSVWYYSNPHWTNGQGKGHGIPRDKIAIGVPCHGYNFSYESAPDPRTKQRPAGYKVERWWEIVEDYGPSRALGGKPNIKDVGETGRPSFRKSEPGTYPYKNNVWYETPATAAAKLDFAKRVGIGTVIVWDASNDDWWTPEASILAALYKASGNPRKPLAGSVPVKPRRA